MEDIIRVLRIVEYVGPRKATEKQISESLHGSRYIQSTGVTITSTTLGTYPEIVSNTVVDESKWKQALEILNV